MKTGTSGVKKGLQMNERMKALRKRWLQEEEHALVGWDFSHLEGRVQEGPLPWDYGALVREHLRPEHQLLDMGTGGGEFLLSLGHPPAQAAVTEGYAPNLALCRERLTPLGIRVEAVDEDDRLPFEDATFDIILNRHEGLDAQEVFRCLKPGSLFLTQQVGGRNNRDLSQRLIPGFVPPYADHDLKHNASLLKGAGFRLLREEETFPPLRFLDVGALVFFARAIPWEFPDFSVEKCLQVLESMQRDLDAGLHLTGLEHRFLLLAEKP